MEQTLKSLHRDHDNLRRILFLLEDLLIDIYRGTGHHDPVFQQILAYIQDYPERVHHPTEDMIYSLIYNKGFSDDKLKKDLNSLLKDHSEIENITRDAISAVERMQVDTHINAEDFGNKISEVIKR
ncbi:MAG: hemerythrin domain-containing protein, partial [Gammaproteobacteria bacterium]|nr:hemerythrin domain-containing protein [Gammaproteobacteria bacterium]